MKKLKEALICSSCFENIITEDYILTKDGYYYHYDCYDDYFYCDVCNEYYSNNIDYEIVLNKRSQKLVACQKCVNSNSVFYCECCNNHFLNENDCIVETERGYFCSDCVESYGIDYCHYCDEMVFTFDNYITTEDKEIFHTCCNGFFTCQICEFIYSDDAKEEVYISSKDKLICCSSCLDDDDIVFYCDGCNRYFLKEKVNFTNENDLNFCEFCKN